MERSGGQRLRLIQFGGSNNPHDTGQRSNIAEEQKAKAQNELLESLIGKPAIFASLPYKVLNEDPVIGLLDSLVGSAQIAGTNIDMDYCIDPTDESLSIMGNYMTIPASWVGEHPLTLDIIKIPNHTGGDTIGIFVMQNMGAVRPLLKAQFFERVTAKTTYKRKKDEPNIGDSCFEDYLGRFLQAHPKNFDDVRIASVAFTAPEGGGDPDEGEPLRQAA